MIGMYGPTRLDHLPCSKRFNVSSYANGEILKHVFHILLVVEEFDSLVRLDLSSTL